MYYTYKIENMVNGKLYIGYTKNPKIRFRDHIRHANKNVTNQIIHKAIRKYGPEKFIFSVISKHNTIQDAKTHEIQLIEQLDTLGTKGYNMTKGGDGGPTNAHLSDNTIKQRNKMLNENSKRQKGKTYIELYGTDRAEHIKQQISMSTKGKPLNLTDEERQRRSKRATENNPMKNGHTLESKQKMIATMKDRKINVGEKNGMKKHPEARKKIGDKNSKLHHIKNSVTNQEILCKGFGAFANMIEKKNTSTIAIYLANGRGIDNWHLIYSYSQSSLPSSLSWMEILS